MLQGAVVVQGFLPSHPLFHLQLAQVRLQDGKMAEQKAESACFFASSYSASESIDVASGPGLSFSQTTDTNWQHVSCFTNQTSSLDLETHLDFLSRVRIGKKDKWEMQLGSNVDLYSRSLSWIERKHLALGNLSRNPYCNWKVFNVLSHLGTWFQLIIHIIIMRHQYRCSEHIQHIYGAIKRVCCCHNWVVTEASSRPVASVNHQLYKPTVPWSTAPVIHMFLMKPQLHNSRLICCLTEKIMDWTVFVCCSN